MQTSLFERGEMSADTPQPNMVRGLAAEVCRSAARGLQSHRSIDRTLLNRIVTSTQHGKTWTLIGCSLALSSLYCVVRAIALKIRNNGSKAELEKSGDSLSLPV